MQAKIKEIEAKALAELNNLGPDLKALEEWQLRYLGKKGELTLLLRETGKLPDAERPAFGAAVNEAKAALLGKAEALQRSLERAELDARVAREALDVTLPGRKLAPLAWAPCTRSAASSRSAVIFLSAWASTWKMALSWRTNSTTLTR